MTAALQALLDLLPTVLNEAEENCSSVEAEWASCEEDRQHYREQEHRIEAVRAILRALIATLADTEGR